MGKIGMLNSEDVRNLVLIYSALVSTLAIGWNILRDLRNRPSLIVKGAHDSDWTSPREKGPMVRIDLINRSPRPLTVVAVGWKATTTKDITMFSSNVLRHRENLPKELRETEPYSVMVECVHIGDLAKVEYLLAKDSTGKIHKSKRM